MAVDDVSLIYIYIYIFVHICIYENEMKSSKQKCQFVIKNNLNVYCLMCMIRTIFCMLYNSEKTRQKMKSTRPCRHSRRSRRRLKVHNARLVPERIRREQIRSLQHHRQGLIYHQKNWTLSLITMPMKMQRLVMRRTFNSTRKPAIANYKSE